MKKLILSVLAVLLLTVMTVTAAADLEIKSVAVSPIHANPSESVTVTVTVENTGDAAISAVSFTSTKLSLNTNTIDVPAIANLYSLAIAEEKSFTFDVSLPSTPAGLYEATLTAVNVDDPENDRETQDYSVIIDVKESFTLSSETINFIGVAEDNLETEIEITNTGSTSLVNFVLTFEDDMDNDDDVLDYTILGAPSSLAPGAKATLTVQADLDEDLDMGSYSETISVTANGVTKEFVINTEVEPGICKYGEVGDLEVTIEDPEEDDEFEPGDTIKLEVEVQNNHDSDDIKTVVKAYLYNMDDGKAIETVTSETKKISDGDDETFKLEIEIPMDVNEDDEFVLYVKAYESGDEDMHCAMEKVEVEIERNEDNVVIEDLTFSKTAAKAGEEVSVVVDVKNLGTDAQDDVFVSIKNLALNVFAKSDKFDLEEFDDDDDEYTVTMKFTVPKDAEIGDYELLVYINYEGEESDAEIIEFTVTEGKTAGSNSVTGNVVLTPEADKFTVKAGQRVSLPIALENTGSDVESFKVDITNTGLWAEVLGTESPEDLFPGDTYHAYVYLKVADDAEPGVHDLRINIRNDEGLVQSKLVSFTIEGETVAEEGSNWLSDLFAGRTLWIVGDIVLLIVALIFLRALFRK